MRRALLFVALAYSTTASAESSIELTLNDQGRQVAEDIGLDVPQFIAQSEARIDELYRLSRTAELLSAFANVAAFAQRGLGVDYDPDSGDLMFGVSATGFSGDIAIGATSTLLTSSSVNAAVMVGVNLARWNLPRWTVFANGFYIPTNVRALEGNLLTLGTHVSYRLVPPTRPGRVRWTGLTATTGLEHARWTVGAAQRLETNFRVEGTRDVTGVHISSAGTLEVHASTLGIPLEVTTGVRLLGVFTPYIGLGAEIATGSSEIEVELDSDLTINADRLPIGTAVITASDSSSPDALAFHALAGLQIHTRYVRVSFQGTIADGVWSLAFGLRVVP